MLAFLSLGLFELFILVFLIGLPLIALIDILKSDIETNNKLLWVLVVLLAPFLGAILYYYIGRKQKI